MIQYKCVHNSLFFVVARSLKIKISNNIWVILPNIDDPYFPLIFKSIERVNSENGYITSLYITSEIPEK